jgi:4-aminobutyrate aminotransferase-like enzyme
MAIECAGADVVAAACATALESGVIALPSGDDERVLSITPPLGIDAEILEDALSRLADALA